MRLARKKKPRDEGLEEGEEVPDDEPEERLKMPKRRDLYTICREAGTFGIYYSQTRCSFALNIATLQSIVQCLLAVCSDQVRPEFGLYRYFTRANVPFFDPSPYLVVRSKSRTFVRVT